MELDGVEMEMSLDVLAALEVVLLDLVVVISTGE